MSDERWAAVDKYITDHLVPPDPALDAALAASAAAGLPEINVTPNQGKLLHLLARSIEAKSVLEVGTLGGYSTIWLARALPSGGRVVTLEVDPKCAEVARGNFERAGVAEAIDLRVGPALETLPTLAGPFDFVFIDADKENTPGYFDWSLKLTRRGGLIVVDNVVRKGAVADAASDDPRVIGMRAFFNRLAAEPRVSATAVQTVGGKGYDGFAVALVTG